jgi:serine/threonine-protein kinase
MRVGERVAHYELLEELGHGGMGAVFRAKDLNTGQEVALKVLPPELSLNPALLQRFRREVLTLRQLHHPGIIRILDVGAEGRTNYFAMEYAGGGNLERFLERAGGQLPVEQAVEIILQLCEALDYAHGKNIVHRDIKPSNILLTEGGHPKLTDFGIAKVVEATRMTVTGGIVGTVDYMAPEQAEGRVIGPKADVYSLGVLLYQMTTGRLPFKGETPSEVIQKHRWSLPEPPRNLNPEIPENLSKVIEDMLQKDPAKRVPSVRALIHILQKMKEQMHPTDPSKQPTVYNLEAFVSPERDTSIEAPPVGRAPSPPARAPTATPPSREAVRAPVGREPVRHPPDWVSRLWLLLGLLLLVALVAGLLFRGPFLGLLRGSEPAAMLLERGLEAERTGNDKGAKALYREIVETYPESREAEAARAGLRRIASITQQQWLLWRTMADVSDAERMGFLDLARDWLTVMKKHWPDDPWVTRELERVEQMLKGEARSPGATTSPAP